MIVSANQIWKHKKQGFVVLVLELLMNDRVVWIKPLTGARGRDKTPRTRYKGINKFLAEYEFYKSSEDV